MPEGPNAEIAIPRGRGTGIAFALVLVSFSFFSVQKAAAQQIEARINRVGLFAGAEPAGRSGAWSFVDVGLRYHGDAPFDGELRVDQLDQDGDVSTSVLPVALAAGAEWRDYQVYYVPHDVNDSGNRVIVRLYDSKGRRQDVVSESGATEKEIAGPAVTDISADDLLVVDLTIPKKLAHVGWLDKSRRNAMGFINARRVRPMSPRELPQRWQGLDAVDAIVWDDADPSGLSPQQMEALLEWVRNGGRLLISAGTNWQTLSNSAIGAELPVSIKGVESRTEALEFLDIVENDEYSARLSKWYLNHPISRVVMEPIAGSVPLPAECANPQIVFRRMLGRGVLTFVGAPLQQLLPFPGRLKSPDSPFEDITDSEKEFFKVACEGVMARRLLGLPNMEEDKNGGNQIGTAFGRTDLFSVVRQTIAFESVGAYFLIFAIFFAITYTLTATVLSNWFLRKRSWQHHAWTAFAMVSLASSAVGFGMVWLLRGVTTRLWQTTIVDAHASNNEAEAVCLFGVRTPDHTRLNLRLPLGPGDQSEGASGPISVVPESENYGEASSKFVDPENYRSVLAGTRLMNIPVRATLKEFRGHWHGPLDGTFDGKLVAVRNNGADKERIPYEFGEGSYLRNNLSVGLQKCYLFETEEEMAGEAPVALTKCYLIGDLPKGTQLQGEELHSRLFYEPDAAHPEAPAIRIKKMPLVDSEIKRWANQLPQWTMRSREDADARQLDGAQEYYSMLLLSFFDLIRHDGLGGKAVRRGHGRTLDCTRQLTRRTAILVGYSQEPAPAVLEADMVNLRPSKARTMYRFLIPVERPEKTVE
jgi:hypothetical protein